MQDTIYPYCGHWDDLCFDFDHGTGIDNVQESFFSAMGRPHVVLRPLAAGLRPWFESKENSWSNTFKLVQLRSRDCGSMQDAGSFFIFLSFKCYVVEQWFSVCSDSWLVGLWHVSTHRTNPSQTCHIRYISVVSAVSHKHFPILAVWPWAALQAKSRHLPKRSRRQRRTAVECLGDMEHLYMGLS